MVHSRLNPEPCVLAKILTSLMTWLRHFGSRSGVFRVVWVQTRHFGGLCHPVSAVRMESSTMQSSQRQERKRAGGQGAPCFVNLKSGCRIPGHLTRGGAGCLPLPLKLICWSLGTTYILEPCPLPGFSEGRDTPLGSFLGMFFSPTNLRAQKMHLAGFLLLLLAGRLVLSQGQLHPKHYGQGHAHRPHQAPGTGEGFSSLKITPGITTFALGFHHLMASQVPGGSIFFSILSISAD